MNLAATLDWAATVVVARPSRGQGPRFAHARAAGGKAWLVASFAEELAEWRECQQVVNAGVTFINEQGLFRGAGDQLRPPWAPI